MQTLVTETLKDIIKQKYQLDISTLKVENPPKKEMGDFAFACFQLAKDTRLAPGLIAQELKTFIQEHSTDYPLIQAVDIAGPYLNITLDKKAYTEQFTREFFQKGAPSFPSRDELVIVDYIGANVGKPLHIGHMCTPNIGQSLINLYKKLGYRVISDSHIGDWGIIFGKLILAYKLWGDEKRLESDAINYLLELYVKISEEIENEKKTDIFEDQESEGGDKKNLRDSSTSSEGQHFLLEQQTRDEFKLLSEGNPQSIALWERITRQSIDFMQVQLSRLNVYPDYHVGESFYEGLSIPKMGNYPDLKYPMKDIVEEVIGLGIAKRNDDGSAGVEFEKMPSTILQKRDGTHGYLASDLATIKYRVSNAKENITDASGKNWGNLKKIVYSVDVRQELHLQQVYDIARRAGWVDGIELFHASNGFISLKDGAMSTRTGKIIRLEELLNQAEERAEKIIREKRSDIPDKELTDLAKVIGIGAIKYGYLSKSRTTNVVFDWDEFMTFEGNSGPYIQYAYVRGKSILAAVNPVGGADLSGTQCDTAEEIELIKSFSLYKDILLDCAEKNMPHILAGYIYELTKTFNSFYNAVNIKNETDENKKLLRLELVRVFCDIVKDGFTILGIDVPEKM